jgi:hypothetical protein
MPEIDGLHRLSLTVRDVESSTAWHERVLGLTRAFAHADDVQGWTKVRLIHPASGMRLSFTQHKANRGDAFSELRTGMDTWPSASPIAPNWRRGRPISRNWV